MANKHKGEVTFKAGDKTFTLRFTINELCDVQDLFACRMEEMEARINAATIREMRSIVRIGLSEKHPELTDKDVGSIMTEANFATVLQKVGEAFVLAFPAAEGGENKARPPKGATAGIGPRS